MRQRPERPGSAVKYFAFGDLHPLLPDSGYRESKVEFGTAVGWALRPDAAAVGFDNSLCNRQSKPGAELRCGFGLPVPVKNVRKVLGRDSGTGIRDRKPDLRAFHLRQDFYLATLGGELDGVADQVRENLKHT